VIAALLSLVVGIYTAFLGRPARHVDEVPLSGEQVAQISAMNRPGYRGGCLV
jgi:hypothetical protein